MYYDSKAWPPPAGGPDPDPDTPPAITDAQERAIMRMVGLLLLAVVLGPFAGTSIILAAVALIRAGIGH